MTVKVLYPRERVAFIDETDLSLVMDHHWRPTPSYGTFYLVGIVEGRVARIHRMILGAPNGLQVDHWNGNGLDNRRVNLRLATAEQNQANKGAKPGARSRFKGVHFHPGTGKWRAKIGRAHDLGLFLTEEDAARAYDTAAIERWGEFSRLNFHTHLPPAPAPTRTVDLRARKKRPTTTSRFIGVSSHKSGRWHVTIQHEGRTRYLGLFDSEAAGARAYDAAAHELRGDRARLNFPRSEASR